MEEEEGSKKDNSLAAAVAAIDLTVGRSELMPDSPHASAAAAASLLTDDLIVEILSRLPVRSVHRFKCVCKLWRDLIAQPAHRKKLPQTLAGFLYTTYPGGNRHHLAGVSAATVVNPSLAFLQRPMNYTKIQLVDTCNGLLLCSCYNSSQERRLVVCNPTTQRWTQLPPPPQPQPATDYCAQRLAFDPAVSPSHFHVLCFEATTEKYHLTGGVSIYSSTTRAWTHRDTTHEQLLHKIVLTSGSVFVGGMLHLPAKLCIEEEEEKEEDNFVLLVVDVEYKAWKTVRAPSGFYSGAIGWSQGRLHYVTKSPAPLTVRDDDDEDTLVLACEIAVWCVEDYANQKWVLKHTVRVDKLLDVIEMEYCVVGIHPDCDTIFFVTRGAYDGDSWEASSLASWDMRRLEFRTVLDLEKGSAGIYLPYVPTFSELTLADGDVH